MPISHHSAIAHAAYHDLIASLQDDNINTLRGTPTKVSPGKKTNWYDSFRVGNEVRKAYIGEDTPELTTRLGKQAALREAATARQAERTRLIRLLRAEGFLRIDGTTGSLLAAMAKAGVFRLGGALVGNHVFRLYEGELGVRYGIDDMARTRDMDIASFERLSLALDDSVSPDLGAVFKNFDFAPVPDMQPNKVWRWKQTSNELMVAFLTPPFEEHETVKPLAALGIDA